MNRIVMLFVVCIALLNSGLVWAGENMMSVQIESAQIRTTPSFLAPIIASVKYGDRLTLFEEQAGWVKVSLPDGRQGWVHRSALTKKKIVLSAGTTDLPTSASADELALAGKGFNSDVEAEFRAQNKDLDYTWVDRMEKLVIDMKTIQRFLEEGEVASPKGGAP